MPLLDSQRLVIFLQHYVISIIVENDDNDTYTMDRDLFWIRGPNANINYDADEERSNAPAYLRLDRQDGTLRFSNMGEDSVYMTMYSNINRTFVRDYSVLDGLECSMCLDGDVFYSIRLDNFDFVVRFELFDGHTVNDYTEHIQRVFGFEAFLDERMPY